MILFVAIHYFFGQKRFNRFKYEYYQYKYTWGWKLLIKELKKDWHIRKLVKERLKKERLK